MLTPVVKIQIEVTPAQVVFRNQSIQGTLVSNMADVAETLDFAKRGKSPPLNQGSIPFHSIPDRLTICLHNLDTGLTIYLTRQTPSPTYGRWPFEIQRGGADVEEWESGGKDGR